MAKRIFFTGNQTFTATAYAATTLADGTYMGIAGGTATQMLDILEIFISGMETASIVGAHQFVRSSGTVFATPTALASPNSDGPMHPATAALGNVPVTFVAATTKPQASATITDGKLDLAFNLFGGLIRWNAAPTQQWTILGNATGLGNSLLFNSTVSGGTTGKANAHIIYEPY
jgi:hypothetical protein